MVILEDIYARSHPGEDMTRVLESRRHDPLIKSTTHDILKMTLTNVNFIL
jgi:hypothetical protein